MTPRVLLPLVAWALVAGPAALAGEPFRFPEGRHGTAELRYREGLPVLVLEGSPEEIGEQAAALLARPCGRLLDYPRQALEHLATPAGARLLWPVLTAKGRTLLEHFPADHRAEFESLARASGLDRERLMVANTAFDLKGDLAPLFQCSALVVDASRSTTGGPLLARNMDYLALGFLHEYSLVTVYRPRGKHAFASVGFPGLVGCVSGMNDAGLAVAALETTGAPASEGPPSRVDGVPFALVYRTVLEECASVDEAVRLLWRLRRTTTNILAVCDPRGGAVIEFTPSRVVVRRPEQGVTVSANHFCSPELKLARPRNVHGTLDRLTALTRVRAAGRPLGLAELQAALHEVHQGEQTLQTMAFEPGPRVLYLALAVGDGPASARPLRRLNLAPQLGK